VDLAGQYGLEDMLDVPATLLQLGGVDEQFETYENGLLSLHGMDLLGFWGVRMSHYSTICLN